MTQLCIRFHVLAFTHVWYLCFSLASLHRFLIISKRKPTQNLRLSIAAGPWIQMKHQVMCLHRRRFDWCLVASLGKASNITFCTSRCATASWGSLPGKHICFAFQKNPFLEMEFDWRWASGRPVHHRWLNHLQKTNKAKEDMEEKSFKF